MSPEKHEGNLGEQHPLEKIIPRPLISVEAALLCSRVGAERSVHEDSKRTTMTPIRHSPIAESATA